MPDLDAFKSALNQIDITNLVNRAHFKIQANSLPHLTLYQDSPVQDIVYSITAEAE